VRFKSNHWERHVLFRNYLWTYLEAAHGYECLKRRLAFEHGSDRLAYAEAKASFIESFIFKARLMVASSKQASPL